MGTEVLIKGILPGIKNFSGEKIQWYLASELRDRIRQVTRSRPATRFSFIAPQRTCVTKCFGAVAHICDAQRFRRLSD